jgi:hypothetical protein
MNFIIHIKYILKSLYNLYQYKIWDICNVEDSYCDMEYEAL